MMTSMSDFVGGGVDFIHGKAVRQSDALLLGAKDPKRAQGRWMRRRVVKFGNILIVALMVLQFFGLPADAQAQDDATYQAVAESTFRAGEAALAKGNYLEAGRQFNIVRSRFQYSQYAPLAELKLGDVFMGQENYPAAVEQFRAFMKLHPSHPEVPYASWKVAMSFFHQIPSDWFFLPPAFERELSRSRDAARELQFFLNRHADTQYAAEARKNLAQVRRRLADHEFYVANFYLDRKNPKAASLRLRGLLEQYSGLGLDAQALFLLARSYLELKDVDRARQALEDLVEYHPNHPLASEAKTYLSKHAL